MANAKEILAFVRKSRDAAVRNQKDYPLNKPNVMLDAQVSVYNEILETFKPNGGE